MSERSHRAGTGRRGVALLVAVVSSLGVASCGDDSADTTSTNGKQPPAAVATGPESGPSGSTELRNRFNDALLDILTQREDLSPSQARCALDELNRSITDEDIEDAMDNATSGASVPEDVLDAAFDAGQACADE